MKYPTGCLRPSPQDIDAVDRQLTKTQGSPLFSDLAPHLVGSGEGKVSAPFLSVMKFAPNAFGDDRQTLGDCSSHAIRNACDISRAVEIDIKREMEDWVARGATEPIYAARQHGGEGMVVSIGVKFVNQNGFMVRKNYEGVVDLTTYRGSLGGNLGGRRYPQEWLDAMKNNKMRYTARLTSLEQVRDALANGYGVCFGAFNYTIDSRTDSNGISRMRRSSSGWAHAQSAAAWIDKPDYFGEPLILVPNSWGKWNNQAGHPPEFKMPVGCCLVPASDFQKVVIADREVFAVGDFDGFKAKDLPDYSSSSWL